MAVVIWEGKNLIQEPSWEKQPLEINLLGWKSSAEQPEGGTGMRAEPPVCPEQSTEIRMQHPWWTSPCVQPCLPHPPEYSQGWKSWSDSFSAQGTLPVSSNCSHRIWLWTGPCLLWGLWSVFNRTGKKFYSKCRTMNGTSVMVPEVTYTVFCYI